MDTSTRGPLSRPGAMYVRGAVVAGLSELSLHRNAISERLPSCPSSAARPKLSLRRVVFSPNKPPGPCAPEQKVSAPRFPSSRVGWPGPGRPEMSVAFSLAMQPRGNSIRYFCPSAARRPDLDAAAGCQPRRADADAGRGGGGCVPALPGVRGLARLTALVSCISRVCTYWSGAQAGPDWHGLALGPPSPVSHQTTEPIRLSRGNVLLSWHILRHCLLIAYIRPGVPCPRCSPYARHRCMSTECPLVTHLVHRSEKGKCRHFLAACPPRARSDVVVSPAT